MEPEARDEFECELRQALEPMPAPPGLKRRILLRREAQHARRRRRVLWWRRLAGAAALLGVLLAVLMWRHAQQQRQGEEARRQVILALRITNRALSQMQMQLAAHNQDGVSQAGTGDRNRQE